VLGLENQKLRTRKNLAPRAYKGFDASNFSAFMPSIIHAGEMPALLRFVMSTRCTHIAETAALVRPFVRLADWPCMSAAKQRSLVRLEAGLIRKTRV